MCKKREVIILICFTIFASCLAQDSDGQVLPPDASYCYEFTWLGPNYNNFTRYNGTCSDYKDETRAGENFICIPPLVISDNGTLPDLNYLWKHYRNSVVCLRSESQVCVKYTYLYNGLVANQSHMCARVRSNKKPITNGCYKEKRNGYEVEMCVCKSGNGLYPPCNNSKIYSSSGVLVFIGLLIAWYRS